MHAVGLFVSFGGRPGKITVQTEAYAPRARPMSERVCVCGLCGLCFTWNDKAEVSKVIPLINNKFLI